MNTGFHWTSNEDLRVELKRSFGELKIPAKSLNVVWGKDRRHWDWIQISGEDKLEGFGQGAALLQVQWLEVVGSLEVASRYPIPTTCHLCYVVKFRVDAFGWDSVPVQFKLNVGGQETETRLNLEPYTRNSDTWHEIDGGEFMVPPLQTVRLSFGMLENGSEWWKGGMILAGVKIKPKINPEKGKTDIA